MGDAHPTNTAENRYIPKPLVQLVILNTVFLLVDCIQYAASGESSGCGQKPLVDAIALTAPFVRLTSLSFRSH